MKLNIDYQEKFQSRHIAPNQADTAQMLKSLGVNSLDDRTNRPCGDQVKKTTEFT
jgi:glycine dehydrogenase